MKWSLQWSGQSLQIQTRQTLQTRQMAYYLRDQPSHDERHVLKENGLTQITRVYVHYIESKYMYIV